MKSGLYYLLFTILTVGLFSRKSENDRCLILALEGGGDRGAYQAGAFKAFVDNLSDADLQYDIFSGISVGSLNSAALSLFAKGAEKNASSFLLSEWRNISAWTDIYQHYNMLGIAYSLFFERSLYDTTPLKYFLQSVFANFSTLQRNFTLGATNINSGGYDSLSDDQTTLTQDQLVHAVMSSSAIPFVFPPIDYNNSTYVDGGVKACFDVPTAVSMCRNDGFADSEIVVDIIMLASKKLEKVDPKLKSLKALGRAFQIMDYDRSMRNLYEINEIFPEVNIRYVVIPSAPLASGALPIEFKPDQIESMIQLGLSDSEKVIKQGEGKAFKDMMEKYVEESYLNRERRMTQKKETPKGFLEYDS